MIERVARAICESQTQGAGFWKAFIPEARAAIAAMREPTEGMVRAAEMQFGFGGDDSVPSAGRLYEAMIDAALEEKP